MPDSETPYPDFTVELDGTPAPVWQCRVSAIPFNRVWPGHQRPIEQSELAGFVTWETDQAETKIVVKTTRDAEALKSVVVRPLRLNVQPKVDVENKTIEFTLPGTEPVTLEIGGFHNCLHLLPFPVYERPVDLNAKNLRYFGPGVHNVGKIDLQSGDEIFVDSGAVVHGAFCGENVENVKISGPGIVDQTPLEREDIGNIVRLSHCKNVTVDGLLLRDSVIWAMLLHASDDIVVRNSRLVGFWRYNADGIDVCNCERVLVENCFLRTFDDSLVVKGIDQGVDGPQKPSKDLLFRNNTIWCDWGRAMELGAETRAPEFANIRFENNDVVRSTHIAMDIQHGDRAKISGVVFENNRIEFDDSIPQPQYQNTEEQQYDPNAAPDYCPQLAVIVINSTFYSGDKTNGTVDNVTFKDITVYGNRAPGSSFSGLDAEHQAKNVTFDNVQILGKKVTNAQEANLRQNEFVQGVVFK